MKYLILLALSLFILTINAAELDESRKHHKSHRKPV
jgi:hypothetical protein